MGVRKPKVKVPRFASEKEEAEWWAKVHFSELAESPITERTRQRKTPPEDRHSNYSPPISIRFDTGQVEQIKQLATIRGTNYQSLIKLWVAERLSMEKGRLMLSPGVAQSLDNLKADMDRMLEERVASLIAFLTQKQA